MITTEISIVDQVSPDIAEKLKQLTNTRPLMRAVGEAMEQAMREHYLGLPQNQRRWPSRGFWKEYGADRVEISSFDDSQATVVVDSVEMGHKYFGGKVPAKNKPNLSIPVSPEAYATGSASLWSGPKLTLIKRKGKSALLVDATNPDAWTIHYVLVPSVTHDPDERAFPPRGPVDSAVSAMITSRIDLIWRVS